MLRVHAVCETHAFRRAAAHSGMSDDEVFTLITYLAEYPAAGDEISGTGGCRKVRWAGRGKGKSGGYRTITFYSGSMCPVYLITVFGKGEKANLTKAERNALAKIAKAIAEEHSRKVAKSAIRRTKEHG
jgi:hypothetical protein